MIKNSFLCRRQGNTWISWGKCRYFPSLEIYRTCSLRCRKSGNLVIIQGKWLNFPAFIFCKVSKFFVSHLQRVKIIRKLGKLGNFWYNYLIFAIFAWIFTLDDENNKSINISKLMMNLFLSLKLRNVFNKLRNFICFGKGIEFLLVKITKLY